MLPSFAYVRPDTLKEAVKQLGRDARVHAGGTDLLGCLHDRVFGAERLVSISALDELRGIKRLSDGGRSIGALTTITEVAAHPDLRNHYPALVQGAVEVASPQLRHQGTLGGNLAQKPRCWYYRGEFDCLRKGGEKCFAVAGQNQFHCILGGSRCFIVHPSDTAPALVALGAQIQISGPRGKRTLPVEKLHVPPADDPQKETVLAADEIITAVLLPPPREGQRSAYRKVRARRSWDFAVAGVALALVFDGGQVAEANMVLSGAAPVPWRSTKAENALKGRPLNAENAAKAAEAAMADATPLAHNDYKVPLFRGLIEEELLKLKGG